MLRNQNLEDIYDGKRYGINDMVKADALGCEGCSKCCETMTDTIILSPLDFYRISVATGKIPNQLLVEAIELNMQDGVILPNIKELHRDAPQRSGCAFLSNEGRCIIHSARPDFCRLFPLGRLYENDGFSYILQVGECEKAVSKVKVKKWIDTPDYQENTEFVLDWHRLITDVRKCVLTNTDKTDASKNMLMDLLNTFYLTTFTEAFYEEYAARSKTFRMKYFTDSVTNDKAISDEEIIEEINDQVIDDELMEETVTFSSGGEITPDEFKKGLRKD